MTESGTWLSYSGDARIWVALALVAVAATVAVAGIRLPLPARLARPAPAVKVVLIVASIVSILVLVIAILTYFQEVAQVTGRARPAAAAPANPITPVTLSAVAALFVIIVALGRGYDWRTRLTSGFIGAIAAPLIFELPFDLVVAPRSHPLVEPGLYRVLLFGSLIAVEVTMLARLWLSPMVTVRRSTFGCLALMLAIFAAWALEGFSYPAAPLPVALNTASKILAFVAALTLFLPSRGAAGRPGGPQAAGLQAGEPLPATAAGECLDGGGDIAREASRSGPAPAA